MDNRNIHQNEENLYNSFYLCISIIYTCTKLNVKVQGRTLLLVKNIKYLCVKSCKHINYPTCYTCDLLVERLRPDCCQTWCYGTGISPSAVPPPDSGGSAVCVGATSQRGAGKL